MSNSTNIIIKRSEENFVSVIMPVKIRIEHFQRALNSLLGQDYSNNEVVIIDDSGSTDIQDMLKDGDSRIKYYRGPGKTLGSALNFGISKTSYGIIARMDGDDLSGRERIKKQLGLLLSDKVKAEVIGSNAVYIDSEGKEILKRKYPERNDDIKFYMPVTTAMLHPTMMTFKRVLTDSGGYDESLRNTEDQELFLRLLDRGYRFYNSQEYLYNYRIREDILSIDSETINTSYRIGKKYLEESRDSAEKYNADLILQTALLEYYKGSPSVARKYFTKYFAAHPLSIFKYYRHFIFSLTGKNFITFLRRKKIPQRVNRLALKYLGYDLFYRK